MKKLSVLAVFAAALLTAGLSSCSKVKMVGTSGEPCKLSLQANTVDISANRVSASKATTEPLPENTTIGVHVVDLTSGESLSTAAITNVKYSADASGALNKTDASTPVILTTGYTYDVYAYSPHNAGVTAETSSAVPVTHGTDVLWAKTAGEQPNTSTHTTNLSFEHKMAQISFRVVADGASNPDITGATIKVTGFSKEGTLDLATGEITPGSVDNTIEITDIETPICFIPSSQPMELNVTVTIPNGANAGTYTGVKRGTFTPGRSTVITVTVIDRNSSLGLEAGMVPWETVTDDIEVNN
ncbi:MAG TPA: fimbrillin family protein [Candidatus Rikenella faecigallinarum]|uniref:Fimbrillin family protein n=1 Tax=Candidatus Rikenella faecigallinarum TaxID=2838745 RepID=A0A9D1QDK8_9BACT|nr:fimbrillin family protein [Candidatus Rikenella faecigallinarum]